MSSGQSDRRWVWWVVAGLLMLSGVAAWATTALWWDPCRSSMVVGTFLERAGSPEPSDPCLVRMDAGTPYPLPVATDGAPPELYRLAAAASVLAAVACLITVVAAPLDRPTRLVGLLLAAALIALSFAGLRPGGREDDPDTLGTAASWLVDITAGVSVVGLSRGRSGLHPRTVLRLGLLLGGVTTFGAVRGILDYLVMVTWSQANWDVPPGTGYLPAVGVVLCSLGMVVVTLRRPRKSGSAPSAAGQVQQVGPVA